jgi:hypothetical protein
VSAGRSISLLAGVAIATLMFLPSQACAEGFGIAAYTLDYGSTQAGAHTDLTAGFKLATNQNGEPLGQIKDAQVDLPSGFVGDPLNTPRCTASEFELFACLPSAQVGILRVQFYVANAPPEPVSLPVYNLTPIGNHLATFAASFLFVKLTMSVDMSQNGEYRLVVSLRDLTTLLPIVSSSITIWGVPASPVHDLERSRTQSGGPQPVYGPPNEAGEREITGYEPTPAGVSATPLLTNSAACSGASPTSTLAVDSWQSPGQYVYATTATPVPTGCSQLHMSPSIEVAPDTSQRDTPAGYDISVNDPLDEAPYELATPALRNVTFRLPSGTSLSPGLTIGLATCSEEQFAAGECPSASKLGTVTLRTPLLPDPLTGSISLGVPNPSATYRIFVSAAADNVAFRLSGTALLDPATGRVTVTFDEVPQLPFARMTLHLFGGAGAALANPLACGSASTTAQLLSYGGQAATSTSTFSVDADGRGGACPPATPFSPSFSAGTISSVAGSASPLELVVSRSDGQQSLSVIAVQLPPGLRAMLSRVPRCEEPLPFSNSCPQASRIGSITLGAGAGAEPLGLAGNVYLTGPYKGAPFGLAIVIPALAGPFDLGTITVRARIAVDPSNLGLTITSDPLPEIVGGIPIRLQTVALSIDRAGFVVTPTNCLARTIDGVVTSAEGESVKMSTPFQVVGCHWLPFHPSLSAATQAGARRRGAGASLKVQITTPAGGTGADIASVTVVLPAPLRPRLSTTKQACIEALFHSDPASCPVASRVGTSTVRTPLLASRLTGPVYLVYGGGEALPELDMVLRGGGITVMLDGVLGISKTGATSAAFHALPDVPISSFVLRLPKGPHSLLGGTANVCTSTGTLRYIVIAQNGDRVRGAKRMAVAGCPKHSATSRPRSRAGR